MKVMTVLGTRPEIIRLSATIKRLDLMVDHTLVHTGQNYDFELSDVFFDDLELRRPDFYLNCAHSSLGETVGSIIAKSFEVLEREKPDALLVLGDTNSCLAAYAARRLQIPVFHMEAGNRCFDIRVPEETNRRLIDHISDINLPYTQIAREYLLAEGIHPQKIVVSGSPMHEVIAPLLLKIQNSNVLTQLSLDSKKYFVVSVHRQENIECPIKFDQFISLLLNLVHQFEAKAIVSTHPRTRKKIETMDDVEAKSGGLIEFHKPFGLVDYLKLQHEARITLSDSGTITEEADLLGFDAINLRETHERPEGMERSVLPFFGFNSDRIINYIKALDSRPRSVDFTIMPRVCDYSTANTSEIVVNSILSYTDYVNRTSYFK